MRHLQSPPELALVIPSNHRCFIGSWNAGGFETVLAADMTYASRMEEGHAGSFGKWSLVGGGGEDAYIILDITTTYPVYFYTMQYTGQSGSGATKLEHPKKMALKICSAGPDKFSVTHPDGPDEVSFVRRENLPQPLLAVRVEELKSLLAIKEVSEANQRATWNNQFRIAEEMQIFRGKQINGWKLS